MKTWKEKVVVITGAGSGMGRELALECANRGAVVALADFNQEAAEETARQVGLRGGRCSVHRVDVSNREDMRRLAGEVVAKFRVVDVVFNNAGIIPKFEHFETSGYEVLERMLAVNVNALGPLRVSQVFWPLLEKGRDKLIVNISSEAGSIAGCGRDGWFGYGMSKAALNMASAQFHNAIRPQGGRVMVIHPGWVRTYMQGKLDEAADLSPEESAAGILAVVASRGAESHARPLYLQWNGEALSW